MGRKKDKTKHRRIRNAPSHPLAGKTGLVSEARAALFDAIGWGPHKCHWCEREIEWMIGRRGNPVGALVVDHLNNDPLDDSLENLVPSCGVCNCTRTKKIKDDEIFIVRPNGTRLRAETRKCKQCEVEFTTYIDRKRPNRGIYCSRSCARRWERIHSAHT